MISSHSRTCICSEAISASRLAALLTALKKSCLGHYSIDERQNCQGSNGGNEPVRIYSCSRLGANHLPGSAVEKTTKRIRHRVLCLKNCSPYKSIHWRISLNSSVQANNKFRTKWVVDTPEAEGAVSHEVNPAVVHFRFFTGPTFPVQLEIWVRLAISQGWLRTYQYAYIRTHL